MRAFRVILSIVMVRPPGCIWLFATGASVDLNHDSSPLAGVSLEASGNACKGCCTEGGRGSTGKPPSSPAPRLGTPTAREFLLSLVVGSARLRPAGSTNTRAAGGRARCSTKEPRVDGCVATASAHGSRTLKVEEADRHSRRLRCRGADERSGRTRPSQRRPLGGEPDGWRTGSDGRGGTRTPLAVARRRAAPHPGRWLSSSSAAADSRSGGSRWAIFASRRPFWHSAFLLAQDPTAGRGGDRSAVPPLPCNRSPVGPRQRPPALSHAPCGHARHCADCTGLRLTPGADSARAVPALLARGGRPAPAASCELAVLCGSDARDAAPPWGSGLADERSCLWGE